MEATTEEDRAMGDLVVTEFVTLDGVMQDPGGSGEYERGGWAFKFDRGPEGDKFKYEELMASDAQLLGRLTYEGFAKAWPTMEGTGDFGEKFNSMPKYVVSKTLKDPSWNNSHVLDGNDLAADVARLKQQYDGNILVAGSAQLVQSLVALDLVDELRLMVFPVVLGAGKRLFADGADTKSFDTVDVKQSAAVSMITLRRNA
jgi:dihydrofolate reductase